MNHPNVADALDKLREIAELLPERNRLQHQANRSRIAHRDSMAELTEQAAERCLDSCLTLAEAAIDLLTSIRADDTDSLYVVREA